MHRRKFIVSTGLAIGGLATGPAAADSKSAGPRIRWTRTGTTFSAVACDGCFEALGRRNTRRKQRG